MKIKFSYNNNSRIYCFLIICTLALLNLHNCSLKKSLLRTRGCNTDSGLMGQNEKMEIITTHNLLRNQIATQTTVIGPKLPYAVNMIQMYYSEALGAKAQSHADNCNFAHSDPEDRKQPQFQVGENIYRARHVNGSPQKSWKEAIEAWFSEVKNFGGKSVAEFAGWENTRHFTQLIWAYSYFIGCGFAAYTEQPGMLTYLYVIANLHLYFYNHFLR